MIFVIAGAMLLYILYKSFEGGRSYSVADLTVEERTIYLALK